MIIFFILGIALGGISVVFVLQNITPITVTFFTWHLTGSLSAVLISAIMAGVLITLLILLPESIRNYFQYKSLLRENKKLHEDLKKQIEIAVFADKKVETPEVLAQ